MTIVYTQKNPEKKDEEYLREELDSCGRGQFPEVKTLVWTRHVTILL